MSVNATGRRPRHLRLWIAGAVTAALVATIAAVAVGYDARETPREEPGVWVARESGQYARVNTDTGELDLVRRVTEPSSVIQSGASGVVLSNGNGRAWPVNPADPVDLTRDEGAQGDEGDSDEPAEGAGADTVMHADEEGESSAEENAEASGASDSVRMPDGTRTVLNEGRFVAVRTEDGGVYVGELAADPASGAAMPTTTADIESRLEALTRVEPVISGPGAGEDAAAGGAESDASAASGDYAANTIALTERGDVAMYSDADGSVRRYDAAGGEFVGDPVPVPGDPLESPQLAIVGSDWVLLDAETGTLLREDTEPVVLETTGAPLLQASDATGSRVLVADSGGLYGIDAEGAAERIVEAAGTPAQPSTVAGTTFAAWIGTGSGTLWSSDDGERTLAVDAAEASGDPQPQIQSNGTRAVLVETRTGMIWTLPDGEAIPLSQWTISDPPKQERGSVVVEEVTEQVAPTAVDDEFGVRAGEAVALPVLLNDFDANKRDVLTIVPESLGEASLPESFGQVGLLSDGQQLTVQVAPDASGTATFRYRVTDGALQSEAATVTLTVADDDTNTAPQWCPVDGCQREWRVPTLAPGGTLVYPILDGWVDPEGDVVTLARAERVRSDDPVKAMLTADGKLAVRHTDANAGDAEVALLVTVRDTSGAETTRELPILVQGDASPEYTASAATITVGETTRVNPLERVAGGSGSYALVDATAQSGPVTATTRAATNSIEVQADSAGSSVVSVTIRDTVTGGEVIGQLRVTATPAGAPLTLPPLRAFVRPLTDSTVEVLAAVPSASSRALAVAVADVETVDGQVQAEVIDHAQVRVAGTTESGEAGRVGAVDVTIAEGQSQTKGRLTVFQVPETSADGAIAVADTARVRAGAVVDVRVLDNDVAGPGERLVLHPDIVTSGASGELAFASGNTLRYVAPDEPGTYQVRYTTYAASDPTLSDVGTVTVEVLSAGSNGDPRPSTLTARVSAGETTELTVPLSGVDPDGDRVRLVSVSASEQPGLTASLTSTGTGIRITAAETVEPGVTRIGYTVRDPYGAAGSGALNVVVMPADSTSGAPVASTDYVRVTPGGDPAVARPLDNDVDPADGDLEITAVVPNVVGDEDSREYRELAERIDLDDLADGVIRVTPGTDLGTVSYRYTVRSSLSASTAEGLVIVQTSERVGVQAPQVTDTILNVRDRAALERSGVDVVTDKVRWATGDASQLTLSLWGGGGYEASGSQISGRYRPDGDTVVFKLSGVDSAGTEVSTYGLLVIPPLDELRLSLRSDLTPLTVDENDEVQAQVRDLVDISSRDEIEVRRGSFQAGRAQATCEASGDDGMRYAAGTEAPWTDVCLVEARLEGQTAWSALPIPVTIRPDAPTVLATGMTRTVSPGQTERIDLSDMVDWQGGREGNESQLRYSVTGGGALFALDPEGARVSVTARADAIPGSEELATVVVSGAGESQAALTLRVGQAAQDLPRGGTVSLQCTVGSSCSTPVVGVSGEHDPFAGQAGGGLRVTGVNAGGCSVGTFSVSGDSDVAVQWAGDASVGATCTAAFTVEDAQGRSGQGRIELDAQGRPSAPSIQQSGYSETSASFTVTLGGGSHPAVAGVRLSGAGSTSCSAAGPSTYSCVAEGLRNGEKHEFTARAVNAVGESQSSNAVTAWAYRAPSRPDVQVTPVTDSSNDDQSEGRVRVSITGSGDVSRYEVTSNRGHSESLSARGSGSGTRAEQTYATAPGEITFTVVPVTRFDVPNVGGGNASGSAGEGKGRVYAAPKVSSVTLNSPPGSNSATVVVDGTSEQPGEGVDWSYGVDRNRNRISCDSSGKNFGGLTKYLRYYAVVCAESPYGTTRLVSSDPVRIGGSVPKPTATYRVATVPEPSGSQFVYQVESSHIELENSSMYGEWRVDGETQREDALSLSAGSIPTVEARQCFEDGNETACSDWTSAQAETAPAPVEVGPAAGGQCWAVDAPPETFEERRALVSVSGSAAGAVADVTAGSPSGETIPLTISWKGAFGSLGSATITVCYEPPAPEDPDPPEDPEPTE